MRVEEIAAVFVAAAEELVGEILAENHPLTWGQSDALGETRHDMRLVLAALADYRGDLPREGAVDWVGDKLGWAENRVLGAVCRDIAQS